MSFCPCVSLSVSMEQLGSLWTDFHEIWCLSIFRKSVEKIQVSLKYEKNKGYFTKDHYTFFTISRSFFLRMRNISDKICRENHNTHFVFNNIFFLENRAVCEIIWKNRIEPDWLQMTVWRMCIACWDTWGYKHTLTIYPYRKPTNASNDHFIVMSSQTLIHVSAYQRHHQGAHMILTSYLHVSVHYRKNNGVSNNTASVSIVTLWKWVVMANCCWKQWTVVEHDPRCTAFVGFL
jgi:hypothetical protein